MRHASEVAIGRDFWGDYFTLGVMTMCAAVRQKQHERFLLEEFFKDAALEADIAEEREAPDFIIRFEGRSIGAELTELYISHHTCRNLPQTQESLSTRIVSRAQQIYQASGAKPAQVTICFGPGRDLRQLNRDRTANELAAFVRSLNLLEWQRVDWRPEEFDGPLPDEISFVHALGVPSFDMAHWTIARAGWAVPLTTEALQARVDEKSKRLLNYRGTVEENWLIIVADATKPSGLFDIRPQFDGSELSSPFSRTFFYGYPDRAVIKLGT